MLGRTRLLAEDAAIGIVFPLLFSIAIILITRYAGSVHLDTDSVLLGELAFAPFNRMVVAGVDKGAKAIYTTGVLLILNIAVIVIFFKEMKIATFDPMLAAVLGFKPALIHYGLMTLVSLTAVGTFQAVGSILVVASTKNILALLKKEACLEFEGSVIKLTDHGRLISAHNHEDLFSN